MELKNSYMINSSCDKAHNGINFSIRGCKKGYGGRRQLFYHLK